MQEDAQSCVVPTVEDVPTNSKKSPERHELVEKIEEAEEFDLLFTQQANYGNDDENVKHPDLMNDVSVLDMLDTVNVCMSNFIYIDMNGMCLVNIIMYI